MDLLKKVLDKLDLMDFYDVLYVADKDLNTTKLTDFLEPNIISEYGKIAELSQGAIGALQDVTKKIKNTPFLEDLFELQRQLLFNSKIKLNIPCRDFPDMYSLLGRDGDTYNLLLLLSGTQECLNDFKRRGIPKDVALGAVTDMSLWSEHFYKNKGVYGIDPPHLNWGYRLFLGSLYTLGRLQMGIRPFVGNIKVYKNKNTNEVRAFSLANIKYNKNGQVDGLNGLFDKDGSWISSFSENKNEIKGHQIDPKGFAKKEISTLNANEWELRLSPDDNIIDVHIPARGPMSIDACKDSFERSVDFFKEHFPSDEYKAWVCTSWLLDTQYEDILKSTSNILKFQREFYLYPVNIGGDDSLKRIFGDNALTLPLKDYPRDSSMQKAVASFLDLGGSLRSGGGFILKDDLNYSRQIYRIN